MSTNQANVFLARQPIFDRAQRLIAYELLFRAGPEQQAPQITDDHAATAQVITRAFGGLGIRTVVGASSAFVNCSAESLLSDIVETLPPSRVVLEILETVAIDDQIVRRCRELRAMGYRLALDDFSNYSDAYEPLLDLIDIVKVDLLLVEPGRLGELVRRLKLHPARLLAEKVESRERVRECLALGFDLFQGFFFGRPSLLAA